MCSCEAKTLIRAFEKLAFYFRFGKEREREREGERERETERQRGSRIWETRRETRPFRFLDMLFR